MACVDKLNRHRAEVCSIARLRSSPTKHLSRPKSAEEHGQGVRQGPHNLVHTKMHILLRTFSQRHSTASWGLKWFGVRLTLHTTLIFIQLSEKAVVGTHVLSSFSDG